jgi:YjbE family integral membrane protein
MQFLYALAAIIVIDLVLAGDNAIVIALAARNLPDNLRTKAILWGTAGAIVVRSLMTVVVVWLLKVPGLMMAGGALLVWIAIKLLAPSNDSGEGHTPASNFWGAMQTIVIADAVMGLDNVLAVAGAAQGSYLLVIMGLLISVPIVVWGSTVILKWVDKYPIIIYFGAAVLAWTAAKMLLHDPIVDDFLAPIANWTWLIMLAIIGGTLGIGHLRNKAARGAAPVAADPLVAIAGEGADAAEAAVAELPAPAVIAKGANSPLAGLHAAGFDDAPPVDVIVPPVSAADGGGKHLRHVLLPISDKAAARAAARQLIARLRREGGVRVHVLHVTPRMPRYVARFLKGAARHCWLDERAAGVVSEVVRELQQAGVDHQVHLRSARNITGEIIKLAGELRCERIVVGSARKSDIVRLFTGSVTGRLLARSTVPVEVVLDGEASLITRIGVPAGVGLALFALALEID